MTVLPLLSLLQPVQEEKTYQIKQKQVYLIQCLMKYQNIENNMQKKLQRMKKMVLDSFPTPRYRSKKLTLDKDIERLEELLQQQDKELFELKIANETPPTLTIHELSQKVKNVKYT